MLTTAQWRQAEEVIRAALKRGADPSEDLDRRGLLATDKRIKAIKVEALTRLAEQLEQWRPDEILRRLSPGPWTPADMLNAIHTFLKEYTDVIDNE